MANRKVYKKNGEFYDQDPVYDSQMKAEGYEEATPEESSVYLADPREAKVFTQEERVDDQDKALAAEITRAATEQGQTLTEQEALDRARNVRSIIGEQPKYPDVESEEEPSRAGDIGGTIVDSVLGGLVLGAPKFAVRKLADAYSPTSYFGTREMERRARANPTLSLGVELGTGLLQGGVSALKTAAPAAFAKLGTLGTVLAETDIAGKATAGLGRLAGRAFLPAGTAATTARSAAIEIEAAAAKRAAGQALTAAEQEVLQIGEAVTKGKPLTVAAIAGGAQQLTKEGEKAVAQRATFLFEKQLEEQYIAAGYTGKVARVLANATANAIVGAGAGALTEAQRKSMERDLPRLSAQEQASFYEDYSAALLRGAATGGAVGGAFSVSAPVVSKAFGLGLSLVKGTTNKLAEIIIPRAGSFMLPNQPAALKGAVVAANALGDRNIVRDVGEFGRALQYQYDNANSYLAHLQNIKSTEFPTAAASFGGTLGTTLSAVRRKFMTQNSAGVWKFNNNKLAEAIKKSQMVPDGSGGYKLQLPQELEALQDEIGRWEQTLIALENSQVAAGGAFPDVEQQFAAGLAIPPNVPLTPTNRTMAPLMPTGMRLAPVAYESFGKAQVLEREAGSRITDLGSELTTFGIPTFLASQLGASVPEALAVGGAFSIIPKLIVNPQVAIKQFSGLQRLLGASKEANKTFANWLVAPTKGRAAAGEAVRKATSHAFNLYSPDVTEDEAKLREPFSVAAGRQLYQMDTELIGRLNGPDALGNIEKVFGNDYQALDASYPAASTGVAGVTPKQVAFLNSKLPKVPAGQKPSDQQVYQYGLYSRYVRDPDAIYDDIVERNYVPSQAIEVLQQIYPSRYKQIQSQLFDAMAEMKERGEKLDSKQQKIADTLLGRGNTAGLTAAQIRALQQTIQLPTGKPQDFSSRRPELEKEGLSPRK